jgi:hypothetical protein
MALRIKALLGGSCMVALHVLPSHEPILGFQMGDPKADRRRLRNRERCHPPIDIGGSLRHLNSNAKTP